MVFKIVMFVIIQIGVFSRVARNIKRHTISLFDLFVLAALDTLVSLLLIFPEILSRFASIAGIGRGVDLFMYLSVFVLLFYIMRLYHKIEKLREDITKLNRMTAISNYQFTHKKK